MIGEKIVIVSYFSYGMRAIWWALQFPQHVLLTDVAVLGLPGIKVEGREEFVEKKAEQAYSTLKSCLKKGGMVGEKTTDLGDLGQVYTTHRFRTE